MAFELLHESIQLALHQVSESRGVELHSFITRLVQQISHFVQIQEFRAKLALERSIYHKFSRDGQRFGLGILHVREETHERSVMLIDSTQARFRLAQSGLQNVIHNPALLVTEKRFERVRGPAEVSVQSANNRRNIGARECLPQILNSAVVGVFSGKGAHACTQGMVAHMQYSKRIVAALERNARADLRSPNGKLHFP